MADDEQLRMLKQGGGVCRSSSFGSGGNQGIWVPLSGVSWSPQITGFISCHLLPYAGGK